MRENKANKRGTAGVSSALARFFDDESDRLDFTANPVNIGELTQQEDTGEFFWIIGSGKPAEFAKGIGQDAVHTLFIENPLTADNDPTFFTRDNIILSELRAIIVPGGAANPSVEWKMRFGPDRSAAGTAVVDAGTVTSSTTTGDSVTTFDNGVIAAGSFVWLELVSVTSGADAPQSFSVTFSGRKV